MKKKLYKYIYIWKKNKSKCRSCCGLGFGKINEQPKREQQLIIETEVTAFLTGSSKGNCSWWFSCKESQQSHLIYCPQCLPTLTFCHLLHHVQLSCKGQQDLGPLHANSWFCPSLLWQLLGFVLPHPALPGQPEQLCCILLSWKRSQSPAHPKCCPRICLVSIRNHSSMKCGSEWAPNPAQELFKPSV